MLRPNPNPELLTVDFPDIGVKQSWDVSEIRSQVFSQKPDEEELNGIGVAATSSSSSSSSSSKIEVNPYFLEVIHDFLRVDEDNLKMASLICFFYLYSVISNDVLAMNITVESEIPIGAGLGSSAALSVCLAAGLLAIKQEQCKIKKETGIVS